MNIKTAFLTLMASMSLLAACSTTAPLEPVATSCAGQIVNGVCNPPAANYVPPVAPPSDPFLTFYCGQINQGMFNVARNADNLWEARGSRIRTVTRTFVDAQGYVRQTSTRECQNANLLIDGSQNMTEAAARELAQFYWTR